MKKIILAYRRVNFVFQLLDSLNKFNELKDVIVFHDGLRSSADLNEKMQHMSTRSEIINYAHANKNVDVRIYKNNIGLTKNLFRIMYDLDESSRNVIIFEEDKLPTENGLTFLKSHADKFDARFLLDTLPLAKYHVPQISPIFTMHTLGGNIVMGPELIEAAENIYFGHNKYEEDFNRNLRNYLQLFSRNRLVMNLAVRKLTKIYRWGLTSQDRPDGLLGYTLFVIGGMKLTPGASESLDISDMSTFGKNVNSRNQYSERVCRNQQILYNEEELCKNCEILGIESRANLSIIRSIRNSAEFRTSSLIKKFNLHIK